VEPRKKGHPSRGKDSSIALGERRASRAGVVSKKALGKELSNKTKKKTALDVEERDQAVAQLAKRASKGAEKPISAKKKKEKKREEALSSPLTMKEGGKLSLIAIEKPAAVSADLGGGKGLTLSKRGRFVGPRWERKGTPDLQLLVGLPTGCVVGLKPKHVLINLVRKGRIRL